jgi:ABC-type nickel/cobalt efflux system permease component RcnA
VTGVEQRLVALFDGRAVFWLALVVAVGVGAAHAVAPGHGKSITAAYLLGTRGRYRDALRLGVIVAAMHTCSVLVLALVWVGLSGAAGVGTRDLTAWLQVVAGLVVIGVGAHLTWRHLRGRGHGHAHPHRSARTPGHGHPHDHQHHDTPAPADPWSRRGLTALAVSGGLLPSPSAFLVLVSGLLTGRAVDALVLVLAFGLGMAVTLTGVGVVTIRGFALLAGRVRRWPVAVTATWLPALAGVFVSVGGCLYLVAAVSVLYG